MERGGRRKGKKFVEKIMLNIQYLLVKMSIYNIVSSTMNIHSEPFLNN